MKKTYEIVQNGEKQSIKYYIDGVLDVEEFYDKSVEIRPGYTESNQVPTNKLDLND